MKISELFADLPVRVDGQDVEVLSMAHDSRRVAPGALFAAWKGSAADGHAYVAAAIDAGATAVLVEDGVAREGVTTIHSETSRRHYARAANVFYDRPDERMAMVGVTGTNGKTTTVHLIEGILRASGLRCAVLGTLGMTFDNETIATGLTTPESVDLSGLLRELADRGADAVAMEVSSHALAQERVAGTSFDVAVFTNLSRDHLDYHGTMEAYFAEKSRLFVERRKSSGHVVTNLDDSYGAKLEGEWTYSAANNVRAKVQAVATRFTPSGIEATIQIDSERFVVKSPLLGAFNVSNILAAIAATTALGVRKDDVIRGLDSVQTIPGRLERVSADGEPLVVVDYAHTPDALEKALEVVRPLAKGRLYCVMGCGGERDAGKRSAMGAVAGKGADYTIVTNDNPRGESPEDIAAAIERGLYNVGKGRSAGRVDDGDYTVILDRRQAIESALGAASPDDAVLIAGKGHEDYQLIGDRKFDFDDRKVARNFLDRNGGGLST